MRSILLLAGVVFAANAFGQDYALVRSQIKAGGASSDGANFNVSGNISMAEANQRMSGGQYTAQGNMTPLTFVAPAPAIATISIAKNGNTFQLSWPKTATGYLLESTASLQGTPVWNILNAPRTTAGPLSSVNLPVVSTPQIYRLRHASTLP